MLFQKTSKRFALDGFFGVTHSARLIFPLNSLNYYVIEKSMLSGTSENRNSEHLVKTKKKHWIGIGKNKNDLSKLTNSRAVVSCFISWLCFEIIIFTGAALMVLNLLLCNHEIKLRHDIG